MAKIPQNTEQMNKLMTSKYLEVMNIERELIKEEMRRLRLIYDKALAEINAKIEKIYLKLPNKDLFDKLKLSESLTVGDIARLRRLERLQEDVKKVINDLRQEAKKELTKGVKSTYQNGYYGETYSVNASLGMNYKFKALNAELILANVYNPLDLIKWSDRLKLNLEQTLKTVRTEIGAGLIQGENPKKVARRLKKQLGIANRQANAIARTEMHRAQMVGSINSFQQLEPQMKRTGFNPEEIYKAVFDARTRNQSATMDGNEAIEGSRAKDGLFLYPNGELARPGTVTTAKYAVNDRCWVATNIEEMIPYESEAPQYKTYKDYAKAQGFSKSVYGEKYNFDGE